jgi:GNAT superfamily N-acetyltransferase
MNAHQPYDTPVEQHTERYFALTGRELDPRTVGLIAAAQTHLPQPQRSSRAPAIAYTYSVAPERELWGCYRDRVLVAIAGVESRAASLWLHDIAVRSDLRRLGIGQRLLEFLRDSYGDIAIEGNAALEAAPFFGACGFELTAFGRFRCGAPRLHVTLPAGRALGRVPAARAD